MYSSSLKLLRKTLTCSFLAGVCGCTAIGSQQRELAIAAYEQDRTECIERFPSGGGTGVVVDRNKCINDVERENLGAIYPYPDLMARWQAERLELAVRVSDGEITSDEATLQETRLRAEIEAIAYARDENAREADGDRARAFALAIAGRPRPVPLAPPIPTRSTNRLNCTSSVLGTTLHTDCY